MGESPKKTDKAQLNATPQSKKKRVVVKKTAKKQFNKAYQEFLQARRVNYAKNRHLAIESFENYLKYYPKGDKRIDALFYLEKLYLSDLDVKNQEKYLNKYYSEAPTNNFYISFADIDKAGLLVAKGKTKQAKVILDKLTDKYGNNPEMKKEIYKQQLPIYKKERNNTKLIEIYTYFIENDSTIKNKNIYYIYNYRLGKIYYDQGNTTLSKKYFKVVAEATDFNSTYMKDFAKKYISK